MEKLHIQKKSYDGYCVGTCVEYPEIIFHAKTNTELIKKIKSAIPVYMDAVQQCGKSKAPEIEVIEFDGHGVAQQ